MSEAELEKMVAFVTKWEVVFDDDERRTRMRYEDRKLQKFVKFREPVEMRKLLLADLKQYMEAFTNAMQLIGMSETLNSGRFRM